MAKSRKPIESDTKGKKKRPAEQKPVDVFVTLMFVSTAALVLGCTFLVLTLSRYDWQAVR